MRKLSGYPPIEVFLQARTIDELRVLQWLLCGAKKRDIPESLAAKMLAASEPGTPRTRLTKGYDSGAEFDKAWKELTGNV